MSYEAKLPRIATISCPMFSLSCYIFFLPPLYEEHMPHRKVAHIADIALFSRFIIARLSMLLFSTLWLLSLSFLFLINAFGIL